MKTDLEDLRRLAEAVVTSPFLAHVGLRADEIEPGRCRLRLLVRPEVLNLHETAQGGAIFTLADATAAVTMRSLGANIITLQASFNFLAPGDLGDDLIAEGRVVHLGRRTGVAEVLVTNHQDRLIARGTFTFTRLDGRHWDTLVTAQSPTAP